MAKIVGILGGVASGKSFVADELRKRGAAVLDADQTGHEVLRLPEVESAARKRWGAQIFGPDGHIERRRLADIVFASADQAAAELAYLEELTHPLIRDRLRRQIDEIAQRRTAPVIVLDAPVLLKAGWDRLCDHILFVAADDATRLARALRRGWTAEQFAAREAAQEPLEVKQKRADLVVDNSGTPDQTCIQIDSIWRRLLGGASPPPIPLFEP